MITTKGIGSINAAKYGEALLEVIRNHCKYENTDYSKSKSITSLEETSTTANENNCQENEINSILKAQIIAEINMINLKGIVVDELTLLTGKNINIKYAFPSGVNHLPINVYKCN